MEEKIKHNDSSKFEDERNKCLSEPDVVNRMPFDENSKDSAYNDSSKLADAKKNSKLE